MIVRNAKGEIVEGGEVSPTDTEHGRRGGRWRGGRRQEETGGDMRGQEGTAGDGNGTGGGEETGRGGRGEGGDGRSLYAESTVECGSSFVYL